MNDNKITVAQYSKIKGYSKQAVYKQLNNKLKEFVILENGKKYIDIAALSEEEIEKLKEVEQPKGQPFEQHLNNSIQPLLENQLAEKDKVIQSLLKQIDSLQEQNKSLTELLRNEQVLMAAEKKIYIPKESETIKEKKGIFGIFKKKNK